MRAPILHEVSDEFDARNAFLQVTLGLVGFVSRFEALLARHGVPAAPPPAAVAAAGDQPFPYLVLGLLAFSRRTMAHVALARGPLRPAPPAPAAPPAGPPRDLLT